MSRRLFISILCILSTFTQSFAQNPDTSATVSGVVTCNEWLKGATVAGATVCFIHGKDTSHIITNEIGQFTMRGLTGGQTLVEVSYTGLVKYRAVHEFEIGKNLMFIDLKEKHENLNEAKVTAEVPQMVMKGDTIVYNAAAVNALQGDDAMQILEQMPGVSVDGGSITVFGETIKRTYVNGILVYGNDPSSALNALSASEVNQIKVYDEQSRTDDRLGLKNSKKDKVLDITTKNDIRMAVDAHLLASGGIDTGKDADGKHQLRYGAGFTGNLFSEDLLLYTNTYINNIGRNSNRLRDVQSASPSGTSYKELSHIRVGAEKYWGDHFIGNNIKADYTYTHNWEKSRMRSRQWYTASDDIPEFSYYSEGNSAQAAGIHEISISSTINSEKLKTLDISLTAAFSDDKDRNTQTDSTISSDIRKFRNQVNDGHSSGRNVELYAGWSNQNLGNGIIPSVIASFKYGYNSGNILQVDTSAASSEQRFLDSEKVGKSLYYNVSPGITYFFLNTDKATANVKATYDFSYDRHADRKYAYDIFGDVPAPYNAGTYDYTFNTITNTIGVESTYARQKMFIRAYLHLRHITQTDDESLPKNRLKHDFWGLVPLLEFNCSGFNLSYSSINTIPSTEQLRNWINDDNLLFLKSGNPALRQSYMHEISARKNFQTKKNSSITLWGKFGYEQRCIANRMIYFESNSTWEGYAIPAGSTLYTYDNINGRMSCSISANYSRSLKKIKSRLTLDAADTYQRNPMYEGDSKGFLNFHSPSFIYKMSGTATKWLRYNISGKSSYNISRNTSGLALTKFYLQSITGVLAVNLPCNIFGSVQYAYTGHVHFISNAMNSNLHNLSAIIGYKMLKGRLSISVSGSNLLDSTPSYAISSTANCITETWRSYYGRSIMLNIGYRFNKTSNKASFRGNIATGD